MCISGQQAYSEYVPTMDELKRVLSNAGYSCTVNIGIFAKNIVYACFRINKAVN